MNRLRGIAFVIHPFPAAMNAIAGALFYWIAAPEPAPSALAAIFLSVLLVHAAIGTANDLHDIDLDRATKPSKPLVRGDIDAPAAIIVAVAAGIAGPALSLPFGFGAFAIALMVLAAGLAYDFALKGTIWSWLPYGVAIPALPVWGFLAAGRFAPVLLLSFPLGALVALALNLANTIPDLAGDTRLGIRGLAHRLGLAASLAATWIAFGATIAALALAPLVVGNDPARLLPGLAAGGILLVAMIADRLLTRSDASLKRGWYLSAALAVVLGAAWVASLKVA